MVHAFDDAGRKQAVRDLAARVRKLEEQAESRAKDYVPLADTIIALLGKAYDDRDR